MVKLVELPEGANEVPNAPPTECETTPTIPPSLPEKQVSSSSEPIEHTEVQQEVTPTDQQCVQESQQGQEQNEQQIPDERSCKADTDSEPFVLLPDETLVVSDTENINPDAEFEPGEMDLIDPSTLEDQTGLNSPDNNFETNAEVLEAITHFGTEQDIVESEQFPTEITQDVNETEDLQPVEEVKNEQMESEQPCVETSNDVETVTGQMPVSEDGTVTDEVVGSTTNTEGAEQAQADNIESENGATASSSNEPVNETEKSPKEKVMDLQEIQGILDKINADIHNIKDKVDDTKQEKDKPAKFADDFKSIRMRNDALRQELISIKLAQNQRRQVDTSKFTEQKIIESTKLHKLKDSTCTLQNEVDLINKARKAQEHLKQVQQERKEAAQKKLREALAAERGPVDVEQIQQSIASLKDEMEMIINSPISEIVPDEENTETVTTEDGQTKPVNKNKKAHDDMMKKYLLMQVMKNNIKELTKKMNAIMAAEGVTPVTPGESGNKEGKKAPEIQQPTAEVKDEADEENDEFYMHNEAEGNGSDLYEEDEENEEQEDPELAKEKLSLAESVARSIATVESVIYKSQDEAVSSPAPDTEPNTQSSEKPAHGKPHKNRRGRKGKAPPENVLAGIRASQQQQKQKEESKVAAAASKKEDSATIPLSKIGTYNFLLKLQREMASMQIQMTKMQENLRAATRTLQDVFETEFADM